MKRTAYEIKGRSFTEPTDLPDGFTVERVEVDDPKRVQVAHAGLDGIRTLTVSPSSFNNWVSFAIEDIRPDCDQAAIAVSFDSARQVRDCLNAILGEAQGQEEGFKPRVFRGIHDNYPWGWYEVKPGLFTYAISWPDARRDPKADDIDNVTNVSLDQAQARSSYGQLVEVTDQYLDGDQ